MPALNSQRELASLESATAQGAHVIGNDAEAVEVARDLLHQADLLPGYYP